MLFEVKYNSKILKVYKVEKLKSRTEFLLYDGYRFIWVDSDDCEPVERNIMF